MQEMAEPKSYNHRHTRNLFFAGMAGLVSIIAAVLLYILFSVI